jgi:hypothetical protein
MAPGLAMSDYVREGRDPFRPVNVQLLDGDGNAELVEHLRGDGQLLFDLVDRADGLVILAINRPAEDAATNDVPMADDPPPAVPPATPLTRRLQQLLPFLG